MSLAFLYKYPNPYSSNVVSSDVIGMCNDLVTGFLHSYSGLLTFVFGLDIIDENGVDS